MDASTGQPQTETSIVETRAVACDGGVGPLGHPKVYLRITGEQIVCPYCSHVFVLAAGAGDSSH